VAPSDRDLAERFIAERLAERRGHGGVWHGDLLDAAAILDTPGVEVVPIYHPLDNAYRMVIRLPVGVIPPAGVAAQHQDRTEGEKP